MNENIVQALKNGELCILPSDTIYGIACIALDTTYIQKIFDIKKRSVNKQMPVHFCDIEKIKEDFICSENFIKLSKIIWPGGVTVVLKCKENSKLLHIGETVAVRIPNHNELLDIISKTGPLIMTSANISNEQEEYEFNKIQNVFNLKGIEDDKNISKKSSTIISFIDDKIKLIRAGVVSYENIIKEYELICL